MHTGAIFLHQTKSLSFCKLKQCMLENQIPLIWIVLKTLFSLEYNN